MPDLDRLVAGLRCRDVLADLSEFLDGNLAPARVSAIQAHLADCDTCARFGGSVGAIVATLRSEGERASQLDASALDALRARVQVVIAAPGPTK
jgi:anti-sigma factor RsiW